MQLRSVGIPPPVRSGRIDLDRNHRDTRSLVLVACILGSVIVFVDSTVVNVALPAIQRDLGGGLALQQWVVDAYLLTLGSLLLVGGSLGDLFGARRLFLIGIVTLRPDVDPLRRRARRHAADPRARPAGRRRRAPHAGRARGDHDDVQGRGARRGDRRVDGVDRDRVRDRAARRRLARHARLVALGLHRQRAVRDRDRRARRLRRAEARRTSGKRAARRRRRRRALRARPRRAGVRADRGAAARLRRPADPRRRSSAGIALLAAFVSVGAARARSRCCRCGSSARRNFSFANIETLTVYAGPLDADVLPRALPAAARRLLGAAERARARADHAS